MGQNFTSASPAPTCIVQHQTLTKTPTRWSVTSEPSVPPPDYLKKEDDLKKMIHSQWACHRCSHTCLLFFSSILWLCLSLFSLFYFHPSLEVYLVYNSYYKVYNGDTEDIGIIPRGDTRLVIFRHNSYSTPNLQYSWEGYSYWQNTNWIITQLT